ncbi:MAG: hypothetical protein Tsb005_11490 [Gammaproteobacteria bacterium]
MQKQTLLLNCVLLITLLCGMQNSIATKLTIKPFGFTTANGRHQQLSDYRGKWVFINYWASWCSPCIAEIPELNKFYQKYRDNKAVVIGVNYDGVTGNELNTLIDSMKIKFPVMAQDPKEAFGVDNIDGIPFTFVINPEGQLNTTLLGAQTEAALEKIMQ